MPTPRASPGGHRPVVALLLLAGVIPASRAGVLELPSLVNADEVYEFPASFIFSSATASYQVEGGWNASGKGENIWDHVTHTNYPPLMKVDANGDVACDSYNKWKEDVALIKSLGMKMYRFSLSWSRILPTGILDVINPDGVRYYNDLITELIDNDISPMISIYHWDLPQNLQDVGGWPNPLLADYFVDYADLVFRLFGDRVKWWLTFNEPQSFCFNGYGSGKQAPGLNTDGRGDYLCIHTVLKAHARTYRLYQDKYAATQKGKVAITAHTPFYEPANENSPEDKVAAENAMQFTLGLLMHPIYSTEGDYHPTVKQHVFESSTMQGLKRSRLPVFTKDEVDMIRGSADFFGLNFYTAMLTEPVDPSINLQERSRWNDALVNVYLDPKLPPILADWARVTPTAFRMLLKWVKNEYNNPQVFITENGIGTAGDSLVDLDRISFYRQYLQELWKAMNDDGCNVIGYTAWSLLDNFEWAYGYEHRYGLFHVDFNDPARTRTPKMSSEFFKMLISSRRIPNDEDIVFPGYTPTPSASTASSARTTDTASSARTSDTPSSTSTTDTPSSTSTTDTPSSTSTTDTPSPTSTTDTPSSTSTTDTPSSTRTIDTASSTAASISQST